MLPPTLPVETHCMLTDTNDFITNYLLTYTHNMKHDVEYVVFCFLLINLAFA